MGNPVSRNMCCSVREKDGNGRSIMSPVSDQPQFSCNEVEIPLDSPQFIAFSPMWPSGTASRRRMALASLRTVHIYGIPDTPVLGKAEGGGPSSLVLESTLELEENSQVTALIFRDEDSARALVIASSSTASGSRQSKHVVQVWSCETGAMPVPASPMPAAPKAMDREGYLASLSDHASEVTQLAVSNTYLLSADKSGECRVWQKNRSFASRATARLHQGTIIDLTVDRHFAYSLGNFERTVEVWSLPDLKPVLSIGADDLQSSLSPTGSMNFMFSADGPEVQPIGISSSAEGRMSCKLSRLTAIRRPASRWSGGSTRTSGNPRGMLFVAGAVAKGQDLAGEDAAVLMEWSLSGTPACQSAIVAHDCPIVCIAFGPYDNGPVVTADCRGLCRVWDCTPRLMCSQQIDTLRCPIVESLEQKSEINVAIASDPLQSSLYSITGDKRLFVWRQTRATSDPV